MGFEVEKLQRVSARLLGSDVDFNEGVFVNEILSRTINAQGCCKVQTNVSKTLTRET